MLNKPVAIADDEHGVLIFHVWENKIPAGVQVLPSSAGISSAPKEQNVEYTSEKIDHVRVGIDSFLARCSIVSIAVLKSQNGYCRVYVNFEVDPSKPGYNTWGQSAPYMQLVRGYLFDQKYQIARINRRGKKVSVVFSGERAKTAETMLNFVSPEQMAATSTPTEKKKIILVRRAPSGDDAGTSAMAAALMKAGAGK